MFPPRNVSNVNTENFTRTSGGNSFIVTGIPTAVDPTADLYPPCKIRDLDATLTNNGDNVLLSWTAPGDDLDSGTGKCENSTSSRNFWIVIQRLKKLVP